MKAMIERQSFSGFEWIDVTAPSREELHELAKTYSLHSLSVEDCLDPEHLPKYERTGDVAFVILRVYDHQSPPDADTVQELSRKVAVFIGNHFLLTIHRKDHPILASLRRKWKGHVVQPGDDLLIPLVSELFQNAIFSYREPIEALQREIEDFETKVFRLADVHGIVEDGYYLKRKSSVFKRTLRQTLEVFAKISALPGANAQAYAPLLQDIKEGAEHLHVIAEEVLENVNSLLALHVSLASHKTNEASHRTNEVMRVLTLFSVFFLPLNFIASIYGMNFEHMPELKHTWAYPAVLGAMVAVALGIFWWFRRRGWLR
ncbi:MAG: hypothetical protein NDJ90_13160 [Oligoflexia bacterium]|nr:hypothetical protein [Oligoflexia bacterium]